MKRVILLAAVAAALVAVAASPAAAATVTCANNQIISGDVDGVIVGPGADCYVAGAHVKGSLLVQPGGAVFVAGSHIDRSVTLQNARWFVFGSGTQIDQSLQIMGTTALPPSSTANLLCFTTVRKSTLITANKAPVAVGCGTSTLFGNTLRGSTLISGNMASVIFQYNQVFGTTICSGNLPAVAAAGNVYAAGVQHLVECA